MNKKIGISASYCEQHIERIIEAKVDTKPTPTTVVHVYMPNSSAEDEEIEEIYEEIK